MICVSIAQKTQEEALAAIERSARVAKALELRMDVIGQGDLTELMEACRQASPDIKIIVTCRRPEESLLSVALSAGAARKTISQAEKMALFRQAATLGADFIDLELACGENAIKKMRAFIRRLKSPTKIIVSWHDLSRTPSLARLKSIFHLGQQTGADVVKIVPFARQPKDNLKTLGLLAYAKTQKIPLIAMCMGDEGKISRVLASFLGSYVTFATLPGVGQSAPGQLTVGAMKEIYRLMEKGESAARPELANPPQHNFVLLGNPVGHSLSPLMHNRALKELSIDGHYSACRVEDLSAAVTGIRGLNLRGASVTIPFKTAVMEYLDSIDEDAAALGAVNTIVNERGILTGYNTDWLGLILAVKDRMAIAGKTFVVLGAGGAARAAVYGLQKEGARVIIVNRTEKKGRALAVRFGCSFYPLSEVKKICADCLLNTTSAGMFPDIEQSPVPSSVLNHFEVVADVIYNPLQTRLLQEALAQGCQIISGLEMFVRQGAGQIKLWTGREAPLALMRKIIQERLENLEF